MRATSFELARSENGTKKKWEEKWNVTRNNACLQTRQREKPIEEIEFYELRARANTAKRSKSATKKEKNVEKLKSSTKSKKEFLFFGSKTAQMHLMKDYFRSFRLEKKRARVCVCVLYTHQQREHHSLNKVHSWKIKEILFENWLAVEMKHEMFFMNFHLIFPLIFMWIN